MWFGKSTHVFLTISPKSFNIIWDGWVGAGSKPALFFGSKPALFFGSKPALFFGSKPALGSGAQDRAGLEPAPTMVPNKHSRFWVQMVIK
jgi:hypothetical protein